MAALPRRRSPRLLLKDPDWSTLPRDLLEEIGTRLPSRREAVKFRSVCPAWRAALPFAKYIAPVLMLPFDDESPDGAVTFYTVADGGRSTFTRNLPSLRGKRLCGSSCGWLALVDEAAGSPTLLNPLTGATIDLPPADERVVGASFRHLKEFNGVPSAMLLLENGHYVHVTLDEMKKRAFRRIVLSSPSPDSGDCVAMAALADSGTVALCRVGIDAAWTLLDTNPPMGRVTSVLHFGGSRFLAIEDRWGGPNGISICDVAGAAPTAARVERLCRAPKLAAWPRNYLEVKGKLYVVATVVQDATQLSHVYKCNILAVKPRWTRVMNSRGLTFFMSSKLTAGYGGAVSVSGFKTNSVYNAKPDPSSDQLELEVIDIANGTSELFQPWHEEIQGSGALCWIQPNHWK
jgi:hypothetical protein